MSTDLFSAPATMPPAVIGERLPVVQGTAADNTASVVALIRHGIDKGLAPEALEKLVALQERVMAKQAEAVFAEAKKAFQAECPTIGKNSTAKIKTRSGGEYGYKFADLEHIVNVIRPLLDRHGFTYDFAQKYQGTIIEVTCILRHVGGHKESTTFSAPSDSDAGMSAAQKFASATTFCQRYALKLALGLPIGVDDDAPPKRENAEPSPEAPRPRTRAEQGAPVVTAEMLRGLCAEWKAAMGVTDFKKVESHFVEWLNKHLPDGIPSNWKDTATWTQAQYDACMKGLGL